jgi:hypothetical protein
LFVSTVKELNKKKTNGKIIAVTENDIPFLLVDNMKDLDVGIAYNNNSLFIGKSDGIYIINNIDNTYRINPQQVTLFYKYPFNLFSTKYIFISEDQKIYTSVGKKK